MRRRVPHGRRTLAASTLLSLAALAAGCGQRGPLTLPSSAQPTERLDPSAVAPGTEPAPAEDDDERSENDLAENGRSPTDAQ